MIRTYLNTHLHSLLSRSLHTHRYLEMLSVKNDHGIYDAHPTVRATFVPSSLFNSNVVSLEKSNTVYPQCCVHH